MESVDQQKRNCESVTILLPEERSWAEDAATVLSQKGWRLNRYRSEVQAAAILSREPAEAMLVAEAAQPEAARIFLHEARRLWPDVALLLVGDDPESPAASEADEFLPSRVPPKALVRRLERMLKEKRQTAAISRLERRVTAMAADLAQRAKGVADLEKACGRLHLCVRNLEDLLRSSVDLFTELVQAERGSVMLMEENGGPELRIRHAKGLAPEVVAKTRLSVGEGVAGWVVREGKPILVVPGQQSPVSLPRRANYDTDSFLSLPVRGEERVIGAINVTSKRNGEPFDENDLQKLTFLAHQFSIAMQNARALQKVESLSLTDALTGLFNRRFFDQALTREIERSRRYSHKFTLAMFDIDYFKEYNDTHGHQAGDAALKQFADVLRLSTRLTDIIVRYGGEEFAVIFPRTSEGESESRHGASHFSSRVRASVESHPFSGAETQPSGKLTVSGGLAVFPEDVGDGASLSETTKTLIGCADERLFQAKANGRNRICGRPSA